MSKGFMVQCRKHGHLIVLSTLAYMPLLFSAPGVMPADTKLYLYTNPWRLLSDAAYSWDARQLGGWVPHQNVGYLWPSGPWFALWDWLGTPDWIAHRLWLGTLLLLAGSGIYWLSKVMGLTHRAAFVAGFVYQLSPFVLAYISRTSALLLPWSLLGWLVGLTILIARQRRWQHIALFGLVAASCGGLNATAILMIAPAPIIWLIDATMRRELSVRRFASTVSILGGVSIVMNAWWMVGLFIQSKYGAAVLSYSEALTSTAATSTSTETLRGLGYWLFYDRNDIVSLTSASTPYQGNLLVMTSGIILIVLGIIGIGRCPIALRRPLGLTLLVGTVLAVGAHTVTDPSPLWSYFADHPKNAISLALRSSSRAVPLVILSLAIGTGYISQHLRTRIKMSSGRFLIPAVLALSLINIPALLGGRLIDPAISRPEKIPSTWRDAARILDTRFDQGHTGSVLLLPGIESAAYRWGYPVDPILPGLTKKRLITRDWLPLGSAPFMDLLYALDDSFQNGTADIASVAPIARSLGADTVMVVNSHQYERFGTIRPERSADIFGESPPGLTKLAEFGASQFNIGIRSGWSSELIDFPSRPLAEIILYAVDAADSGLGLTHNPIIISGDGTGVVNAASAHLIDGSATVLSSAHLDVDTLVQVLKNSPELIVTDSNRIRAHHWRSSQEVWGATESLGGILTTQDVFDSRLPVFPDQSAESRSYVRSTPIFAKASVYGTDLTYLPEFRPAMAIDGDPTTSWKVGVLANPIGQSLTISSDKNLTELHLIQPLGSSPTHYISKIEVIDATHEKQFFDLLPEFLATGQKIILKNPSPTITIYIEEVSAKIDDVAFLGFGFAEVLPPLMSQAEVIQIPIDAVSASAPTTPTSFLFTRLTADPYDHWRDDPEHSIQRSFDLQHTDDFTISLTATLNTRASDEIISNLLGSSMSATASTRLSGTPSWWGLSALDDDPFSTWWSSPSESTPPSLSLPLSGDMTSLDLTQVISDTSNTITQITIAGFVNENKVSQQVVDVPEPDAFGHSHIEFDPVSAQRVTIAITGITHHKLTDSRSRLLIDAPVGISSVASDGWTTVQLPTAFDTECRTDLLAIDERPIGIDIAGTVEDALRGAALAVSFCDTAAISLASGNHRLITTAGLITGIDINQIVLRSKDHQEPQKSSQIAAKNSRTSFSAVLPICTRGCWIESPQGWNVGWSATIAGAILSEPISSAGGRNTWFATTATNADSLFVAKWTPQKFMWLGIAITLGGLVISIGILLWAWRTRRIYSPHAPPNRTSQSTNSSKPWPIWSAPLLSAFVAGLVISPLWGLAIGIIGLMIGRRPDVCTRLGMGLVFGGLLFVLAQQIRTGAPPGFSWPEVFHKAHRLTLAGLVLLTTGIMCAPEKESTASISST